MLRNPDLMKDLLIDNTIHSQIEDSDQTSLKAIPAYIEFLHFLVQHLYNKRFFKMLDVLMKILFRKVDPKDPGIDFGSPDFFREYKVDCKSKVMTVHQYFVRLSFFSMLRAIELLRTKDVVLSESSQFPKSSSLFKDKRTINLARVNPKTKELSFSLVHHIEWKKLLRMAKRIVDSSFDKFNLILVVEDMISNGLRESG